MEISHQIRAFYDALPKNHMLRIFFNEHELILEIMEKMRSTNSLLQKTDHKEDADELIDALLVCSERLLDTVSHLDREEVLYNEMIARKMVGPPRVMAMDHKMLIRNKNLFHNTMLQHNKTEWDAFRLRVNDLYMTLYYKLWDHLQKEHEEIFFLAFDLIKDDKTWIEMSEACDKIGYDLLIPAS
jgi:DUF438 domain-containing protein